MNTFFGKQLRYLLDKALAQSIITETYEIPTDLDPSTRLVLEEIWQLGVKLINKEGIEIIITPEDFMCFWTKMGEFTSSLMSGVHYGNYKAWIKCATGTKILVQQLTVVARSRIPPENWSIGLQVMLEKIAGVRLVKKLMAIQLYKADFNCYSKFIFGKEAMNNLNSINYVQEELFSQIGVPARMRI
jgi:hypothetical protein